MLETLKVKDHPELQRIIRAALPKYRKHNCFLSVADQVEISGTYWDGGSRNTYHAVNLLTYRSMPAPQFDPPQHGGPRRTPQVEIPPNVAIIQAGTFCGKQATAHLYLHPDNVAKLFPKQVA